MDPSGNVLARSTESLSIDDPLAQLRAGSTSYYEADGLGSITSLSNSGGTVAASYTYDSFGNMTASTGSTTNPLRYTAREFDSETNLYYYRARYYDPATGRLISEDPIGFSGGANFYAYVSNSPLSYADPFGLKDVYVVIWNRELMGNSVGHVVVMDTNGNTLLSQFPTPHASTGENTRLDWTETYNRENRDPNAAFKVHVPDDPAFDAAVLDELNKSTWNWLPTNKNQTNCVVAADKGLKAGGVPVGGHDLPGYLGDTLSALSKRNKVPGQQWSVTPVPLSNLPGPIHF